MPDRIEKRAVQVSWDEVCNIVSAEVENILGLQLSCKINIVEDMVWAVMFDGCRLPLPKLCQLLQVTQAAPDDWMTVLPNEGKRDVGDIGMELAEKLLMRYLNLTWEHRLITEGSLWLVGVTDICKQKFEQDCGDSRALTNALVQALTDIADYFRSRKDKEGG